MAGVFIDIPGIGNIEAKNAATEATLKEILKALKGAKGGGGGGSGGSSGGGGGGGAAGGAGAASSGALAKGGSLLGKTFGALNRMVGGATGAMAKTAVGGVLVAKKFVELGEQSTQLISEMSNVGDSLTAAASALRNIPVVGGILSSVFGAVAAAVEKSTGAYQAAASAGASFTGSVGSFSRAASEAGMTMENFGALIKANGEGMLGLGTTVEEGAKRFSQVSKALRATGSDLYALGYSTQEINEGLASYSKNLRMQGLQGTKTNAELAAGAKSYLKEMDALAKITGEDRKAKEAERERLLKDAQFQASMSDLNDKVRDSFLNTVQQLPQGVQNFAKDILATGTATTEENQKLMAMMPHSAAMLQTFNAKMQRGEAITMEERNRLNNLMAKEGPQALKGIKYAGAASGELAGLVNGLADTQKMQTDAVKQATAEQKKAAEQTDGQNKAMEEAKQRLAAFSNSFTMFLAQSGLLDTMMKVFQGLATVIQTVVVPVFQVFAQGLTTAVDFVSNLFSGADLESGFGAVMESAKKLLGTVGSFFETILLAVDWQGITTKVMDIGNQMIQTVDSVIQSLTPTFTAIVDVGQKLFNTLTPIFTDVLDIIKIVASVLAPVIPPIVDTIGDILGGTFRMIGGLIKVVKGVLTLDWDTITTGFGDIFGGFWDRITGIFKLFKDIISGGWGVIKGLFSSEDDKKIQQAEAEQKRASEKKAEAQKKAAEGDKSELERLERVEAQKKKYQEEKKKAEDDKKKAEADQKKAEEKKAGEAKKSAEAAKKEDKPTVDYNDSLAILKSELEKTGTVKSPGNPAVANAEASRKEMESKAQSDKQAKEQKAASKAESGPAAESGTSAPGKTGTSAPPKAGPGQESAETLLAQLNSKMDQLIRVNTQLNDLNERQLRVQQSLTGDLFVAV